MPKPSPIADNRHTATLRDWWFVQAGNHTAIQGRVFHAWNTYNDIAFDEVTRFMTPCERKGVHISVKFD